MNDEGLLEIDDLIRALDAYPAYRAIDVFGSSVHEVRTEATIPGLQKVNEQRYRLVRNNRTFEIDWFTQKNVLRLSRQQDSGSAPLVGAGAGAVLGAAIAETAGLLAGGLLGLLVGAAIAGSKPEQNPVKIFTLKFDPLSRQWGAYDGGLVPWMKEKLFVPGA